MRVGTYNAMVLALKKRDVLEQQVKAIEDRYQPRITKLTDAMNKRTDRKRIKIRTLTTKIKMTRFVLNGGELSRIRRLFPHVKDL
jgi:hypothetical protein